eukprot:g3050.t1
MAAAAPSRFDKTNKVLEKALKSSIRSRPAGEVFVKSLSALPLDASEAQRLCMDSMQSVHRNIEKEFALYCSETKLKEKLDQLDARFEEQPVISSSGERWCVQVPPPARVAPDAACRSKRMHVMDSECAILEARLAKLQERNGALKGEVAGVREEANGLVCRMQETLALDPMDAMVA